MPVDNLIKNIRNIMRKDAGVAGDGQRIEQIVWMLFLKIFDDQERFYELRDDNYRSPLPEELRWRKWAADPEGMTGDELLEFVNLKLFPGLKEISNGKSRHAGIIKAVFEDANNYMKSGTNIRQVVNQINRIDFTRQEDRHLLNDIYETILKELQSAGDYGEFYTPRPLTKFIVDVMDPQLGEKVFDPSCGTGGFLVNVLEHVEERYVKTKEDRETLQESIYGTELKPLPHMLAVTNMMLHGVEVPENIKRDDTLARPLSDYTPNDKVDVIVTNPPFGASVADGVESNFPSEFRTKETADLFLYFFIHILKPNGRAGIVIPDGTLFGEGVKAKIKQKLLQECNLHTIVRLPQGVFNPYAGVNTNLLFFEKGTPTEEIWYYQLPLPEGMKQYTKNRGITHVEFDPVREWWNKREENENAWKVSIEEVEKRNYNLDFKNPNGGDKTEHQEPEEIIKNIEESEKQITKLLGEIKSNL
ncbi:MAG: N-6 DNA methylase [Candidatus Paceibacterota bacterium]